MDSGKKRVGLLLITGSRTLQAIEDSVANSVKSSPDCAKPPSQKEKKATSQTVIQTKNEVHDPLKIRKLDTIDEVAGSFRVPQNHPQKDNNSS